MAGRFDLQAIFSARDKGMRSLLGQIEQRSRLLVGGVGRAFGGVGQATRTMERSLLGAARTAGSATMALGRGLAVGGTLGAAALTGVAMAADSLSDRADHLLVRSTRLRFDIGDLQEWEFAAGQAGVATEDFDKSLDVFSKNLGAAKFGTGALAESLKKTNPALLGQLRATESISTAFDLYIASLRGVADPSRRATLAAAAFGKSGLGMIAIADQSAEAIAGLRAEARENGIMTLAQAEAAEAFGDSMVSLKRSVGGFVQGALLPLMPHLDAGARGMREWVLANRELVGAKLESFIGALRTGLPPVIARVREIGAAISSQVVGPVIAWARANEGLIRTRVGEFFDELVPTIHAFGEGVREGLRDVRAFAGGVVEGLAAVRPVAEGAFAMIGRVFSAESTDKARTLGEVVVKLGGAMVGLSIATRAAAVVGVAWTAVTKTAAIVSAGWALGVRAVRAAMISYEIATKAGVGATIAMSFASKAAAADMLVTRTAAFAAAGGFKAMAISAGAAAAAVGAVMVAVAANDELKKTTGGLGIFDIAGGMIEQGTIDPFKVVDKHMNEQARRAAGNKLPTGGEDTFDMAGLERMLASVSIPDVQAHAVGSVGVTGAVPVFGGDAMLAGLEGRLFGAPVGTRPGTDAPARAAVPAAPGSPVEGLGREIASNIVAALREGKADEKLTIEVKAPQGAVEVKKPKSGKTPVKVTPTGGP